MTDTAGTGKLQGRAALITGGTSGIGKATALLFIREGAAVAFTGRRAELGKAVAAEMDAGGGRSLFIAADHTREEDCRRAVEATVEKFGRLDILFNNAGVVVSGTTEETSEERWAYTLDLNVTAIWRMSKLALRIMRAQGGGVIVNNASDWGLVGGVNAVAYCTSKGAVVQMTRAMAMDHAREKIRVNAVCPGDTFVKRWVEQGFYLQGDSNDLEAAIQEAGEAVPMGRVGKHR